MSTFHYVVNDSPVDVHVELTSDGYHITVGETTYHVTLYKREANSLAFTANGVHRTVYFADRKDNSERLVWTCGRSWIVDQVDQRRLGKRSGTQAQDGALTASMPGIVQNVLVREGNMVQKGDTLVVMEAMKMEIRISAPRDGVIATINCEIGAVVERGQTLIMMVDA